MTHLFVLSPTGGLTPGASLSEALALSLNYLYVLPLTLPSLAPTLHPCLEALFHVTVAWAVLLLGFASDSDSPRARALLLLTPLLTNIVYLPYLVVREPSAARPRKTGWRVFCESPALPVFSLLSAAGSVAWGALARPQYGALAERVASFGAVLQSDLLAHSFAVDVVVFAAFQAALVAHDARRRRWRHPPRLPVLAARLVPFFGLVAYLLARARWAGLAWEDDDGDARAQR